MRVNHSRRRSGLPLLLLLLLLLLLVVVVVMSFELRRVDGFSHHISSNSDTNGQRPVSFPSSFDFATNGVCVDPYYFVEGSHDHKVFTMRNVPGDGDCMFLAVALAAATSMGVGGNNALLRAISRETREVVAQLMEGPGNLYIGEGYPMVSTKALLQSATNQEGLSSTQEYLTKLRLEGRMGGLYGGGPELTALSNALRRPISIYELKEPNPTTLSNDEAERIANMVVAPSRPQALVSSDDEEPACDSGTSSSLSPPPPTCLPIVCKGTFGNGLFEDPCASVENSAVLQSGIHSQPGAYSWHLHILILNVEVLQQQQRRQEEVSTTTNDNNDKNAQVLVTRQATGEKHACVLLPTPLETDGQ